ncbi:TM2 domain-containing protein [Methyloglobulus sp.]|uniref:TM2 domain-containing protein n=1 Tax=Methyloglobulus sp. TaxID=2518622 RepID=UPI003989AED1
MIGVIKDYDPETQAGSISNGREVFQFEIKDWIAGASPEQGDQVKFDIRGVKPCNINLYAATLDKGGAVKRKYLAVFLAFLFGYVGGHRFYLGYYRIAVTQIIVNTLLIVVAGLPGYAILWGFVEAILILGGHIDKDAQGRPLK